MRVQWLLLIVAAAFLIGCNKPTKTAKDGNQAKDVGKKGGGSKDSTNKDAGVKDGNAKDAGKKDSGTIIKPDDPPIDDPPKPVDTRPLDTLTDEELVQRMADTGQHKQVIAALLAKGGKIVPQLTEALKHESWQVRFGAAAALGQLGDDAKDALPALKSLLENETNETVRETADIAISALEEPAKKE